MDEQKKDIAMNISNPLVYLTNFSASFQSDEEVILFLDSGSDRYRFIASPKHLKRMYLYLRETLDGYEKKYGFLETHLPQMKEFLDKQKTDQ